MYFLYIFLDCSRTHHEINYADYGLEDIATLTADQILANLQQELTVTLGTGKKKVHTVFYLQKKMFKGPQMG